MYFISREILTNINPPNLNTRVCVSLFFSFFFPNLFSTLESTPTRDFSLFLSGRISAEWTIGTKGSQPLYRVDVVGGLIASAVAANHGVFVSNTARERGRGEYVRIDKPYSPVRSIIHKSRQPGGCQRDKVVIVDQPTEREREEFADSAQRSPPWLAKVTSSSSSSSSSSS